MHSWSVLDKHCASRDTEESHPNRYENPEQCESKCHISEIYARKYRGDKASWSIHSLYNNKQIA